MSSEHPRAFAAFGFVASLLLGACAEGGEGETSGDQELSSSPFPAFKEDLARGMAQLKLGSGGSVLARPRLVTVTLDTDLPGNVRRVEAFGDAVGESGYWRDTMSEYG